MTKPSVVVIVLDSLRADMLSSPQILGHLPTLSDLLHDSYIFRRAYAPACWTLPSHASLFTGKPPTRHMAHPPHMKLRDDLRTIAEIYRDAGYSTACVAANAFLSDKFGLTRGFDLVLAPKGAAPSRLLKTIMGLLSKASRRGRLSRTAFPAWADMLRAILDSSPSSDNGIRDAVELVRGLDLGASGSLFLVVNLMEAHQPYYARGPFSSLRSRLRYLDLLAGTGRWDSLQFAGMNGQLGLSSNQLETLGRMYWEGVRFQDVYLRRFLESLPKLILDEGFVIVLSDHGQLLGEDGRIGHLGGFHERLIRVPLVVRPPGGISCQQIDQPVETTWLFKLLQKIPVESAKAIPDWFAWLSEQDAVFCEDHGGIVPHVVSIADRMQGPRAIPQEHLLNFAVDNNRGGVACICGNWKIVCHFGLQEDELYYVESETGEEVMRVKGSDDILEELHAKLQEHFQGGPSVVPSKVPRDELPTEGKRAIAETVLQGALELGQRPVVVWTSGRDSTLALHFCMQVAQRIRVPMPPLMVVDHGQHFPETWTFVRDVVGNGGLKLIVARNEDVLEAAGERDHVLLDSLDSGNQDEALKAGVESGVIPLSLRFAAANHLLKTVAFNQAIRRHDFDMVITGIRWDESPARSNEVFFSRREDPPHMRVHPILPWTEREVWAYTLEKGLLIHPLYRQGFRSFDGIHDSTPFDDRPAWDQDLDTTLEREGRAQDKEQNMHRLRALGYF